MQHHNYSLSDIENLMPWERDIYVDMLITYLKEEKETKQDPKIEKVKLELEIDQKELEHIIGHRIV